MAGMRSIAPHMAAANAMRRGEFGSGVDDRVSGS
jgi:hypothetical protein